MAKVINLTLPGNEPLNHAAWLFAHAALWPDQQFSKREVENSVRYVSLLLVTGKGSVKQKFLVFCQRIMTAVNTAQQQEKLPKPSVWLNPDYAGGYSDTNPVFERIANQRKSVPNAHTGIMIVAHYYWNRIGLSPTASFPILRRRLLQLEEPGLLSLTCRALMYHFYLSAPQKRHHERTCIC